MPRYQEVIATNRNKYLLIGKLDITTGDIESPRDGMLGMLAAAQPGMVIIVPEDSEVHASIVAAGMKNIIALKARNIGEVWRIITGQANGRHCRTSRSAINEKKLIASRAPDLKEILGNSRAKLALETALAGRHSLLLVGPAGQGKSMLAKAATKLLPDLELDEILEVNKVYSARGELAANELILCRPYQEASNSVTEAALFGGGTSIRPGLISAAHRGILFFDEVNLTSEAILDQLRAPWANGEVDIQRANGTTRFPAKFQFIGAMNPCKCSWYFHYQCSACETTLMADQKCPKHPKGKRFSKCTCTPSEVSRYLGRLSQPIKDRIEVVCLVSRYDQNDAWHDHHATVTVKGRIKRAWDRQLRRYAKHPIARCNGDIQHIGELKDWKAVTDDTEAMLERHLRDLKVRIDSMRKSFQLLVLSRTVADLEDSDRVGSEHIAKAISIAGVQQGILR
jgi:magnesium chelatase family protein